MNTYSKAYLLFVWGKEGGWADRPRNEDPGGKTNRGVTIGTWQALAPKLLGIAGTEDTLRKITFTQFETIFRYYYNAATYDGSINSVPVAEWATELQWASGGVWDLQRAYNTLNPQNRITVDGVTGPQTVNALNAWTSWNANPANTLKLLDQLYVQRYSTLKSLPNAGSNPGWFPRLRDFHEMQKKRLNTAPNS